MTDQEVQNAIASTLRDRLRKAGFVGGASSAELPPTFSFPINLDLAGAVAVIREPDGTWVFRQETDQMLFDRIDDCLVAHGEAIDNRECPTKGDQR